MRFALHVQKLIEAAGVLLNLQQTKSMEYLRLLKLLYIANRECLKETGQPVVGGRQVAMRFGPVPSAALDLIKGRETASPEWSEYIETQGYNVRLIRDPGRLHLTKHEVGKLVEISEQRSNRSEWELVDETHGFDEYKLHLPPEGRALEIPWEDIARAVGLGESLDSIQRFEDERNSVRAALRSV